MAKHARLSAADRRALIGGMRCAQLRRHVSAAEAVIAADAVQLVERDETPEVQTAILLTQLATDIAWPPGDTTEGPR